MARSPLMRALRRIASNHETQSSRGQFLRKAALAATGAALLPEFVACGGSQARGRERIVIVGAGIAGLVTAMRLRDAGIDAAVYESSDRIGGRMHSERVYWDEGQHTEWCGAMVDSLHVNMRGLARRFGLRLLDTYAARPPHARDTCYLDGRYYSMVDADRDFRPVYAIMQRQLAEIDPQTTYANATPEARRLDAMSMRDWIERYVPGALNSQLGRLIKEAYRNEYGREIEELSSINLVVQLGEQRWYRNGRDLNVLGYSDQRYIFANGSQSLPEAIARSLPQGTIRFNRRLAGIRRLGNGSYELRFGNDGNQEIVNADRVVLAIPFIVLRDLDFSNAGFDAAKVNAIDNLGYGYHTKLHLQFDRRAWMRAGHPWPEPTTGQIWTTLPVQSALDFSLGQSGNDGLIEVFTAAGAAMLDTPPMPYARLSDSPAVRRHVTKFFQQLDHIWPGVSPTWNGKATMGNAQADPNILASYSCWLVGQCTTIAGHEATQQGRVHFAGEHTSVANQGFMEGGAESGFRAANEILADYKLRARLKGGVTRRSG
ncbi:MAG TPA: NAD(P)/FAD-dependent oxidoreductase [Candidatus Baltobacteraceae bacterium]|nr:NAD(P)/FAD-dependent oxidoreductase [Candidatus Baltobacteraceae bacterium]